MITEHPHPRLFCDLHQVKRSQWGELTRCHHLNTQIWCQTPTSPRGGWKTRTAYPPGNESCRPQAMNIHTNAVHKTHCYVYSLPQCIINNLCRTTHNCCARSWGIPHTWRWTGRRPNLSPGAHGLGPSRDLLRIRWLVVTWAVGTQTPERLRLLIMVDHGW